MKQILTLFFAAVLLMGCKSTPKDEPSAQAPAATDTVKEAPATAKETAPTDKAEVPLDVKVTPLQHASMILEWDGTLIAVDPVKGALDAAPGDEPKVDLILVTDIHGDHFDAEAVASLRKEGATVVAPQAVIDQGGDALPNPTVLANGETKPVLEGKFTIEGVPMYNLVRKREDSGELFHVKGRGNGYILSRNGKRLYISGDTECIPEMKALTDIDVAFVCMNLPFTMPPEEAAECIREFKPAVLYPYHYRDQDPTKLIGLLDGVDVQINQLNWYP